MRTLIQLAVVAAQAMTAPAVAADRTVTLTDPAAPAGLVFRVPYVVLEVVGSDRSDVAIRVRPAAAAEDQAPFLPASVQGNQVEIVYLGNEILCRVRIEVPRRSDLVLESSNGGPMHVRDIHGDVEIVNSNAGVVVEEMSGSLSVATSNGAIRAELNRVDPSGAVSLITSNGTIDLALPADFQGRVLAETDGDPIASEFDVAPEPASGLSRPGRILSGRIGNGGPLLRLRTENAGITLTRGERASPPGRRNR